MGALYEFTAHYFERKGVESAAKKWEEVGGHMKEAVEVLDALQGCNAGLLPDVHCIILPESDVIFYGIPQ